MATPSLSAINVDSLVRRIQAAHSVLLTTHKQCDGDGLGALLALYHGLRKSGKQVRVMLVDACPRKYFFLEPEKHLEVFEASHTPLMPTDLTLVFDTNDRRLVDPLFTALQPLCREILFVDHHPVLNQGPEPTPGSFIETRAASTGEISYFIIKGLGLRMDERMAQALYTSIAFDTQVFKFVKNSVNSHLIAAELLTFINNAEEIHRHLFSTHTIEKVKFLSKVLGQIEYFGNGQVAVLRLSDAVLKEHGLDMDDSRDVIDMLMHVNSLRAAALFREDAPNEYKLSLRSKGHMEVLGVAEAFQGGGHMFAAGAYIRGDYHDIKGKIVQMLLTRLDDAHDEPSRQK
ncbi:MAG TPA: DHH family phosphoesterase [Bdellovibrionales bacterium]|nr:DHH family phosphoesterase [Bdellovibrionales bacterium]